ncbi:MAG: HNH endonuclease [Chloroflexi bacterium]|nr:HNH endonuclease [Chloroflexota bacterium]
MSEDRRSPQIGTSVYSRKRKWSGKTAKSKTANKLLLLKDNLIVTQSVENRLREKADKEVPEKISLKIYYFFNGGGSLLFFWVSGIFVVRPISDVFSPFSESVFWLVLAAWYGGLPLAVMAITGKLSAEPSKEREKLIDSKVIELAEQRERIIEESNRFYSSPEWVLVREQVIRSKGKICAACGTKIIYDYDLTVDHIHPRSKYPNLSLSVDNLQVLCRRCNSRKGAR